MCALFDVLTMQVVIDDQYIKNLNKPFFLI